MKNSGSLKIGQTTCCCSEDHEGDNHDQHAHELVHPKNEGNLVSLFIIPSLSFILLITALALEHLFSTPWFSGYIKIAWYSIAYLLVGFPVIRDAFSSIQKGDIFSEFLLMTIATIGAFAIGEYPEGVAVMLFYAVGETFQSLAVSRAKRNIKTLLDQRPDTVTRVEQGHNTVIRAEEAQINDILSLKPGEKVALDGKLLSNKASFNTAALTGESKPISKKEGDTILAGMINLQTSSSIRVTTAYADSKLSKILDLIQHASKQKAPTELFIKKFAKIYTPIVVLLAAAICFIPWFFVAEYNFSQWLYRALIFLVISCPCALVISIPLGYFGGIGAASKHGILVKGSNYLDTLAHTKHIVLDKTGTLTEGVFAIQEVVFQPQYDKNYILQLVQAAESRSTHPIATAIKEYTPTNETLSIQEIEELPGYGLRAYIAEHEILVGNFKLLDKFGIKYDIDKKQLIYTTVAIALDNEYVGYITIADRIKSSAPQAIKDLNHQQIKTTILSGDQSLLVERVAQELEIPHYYGDLLPQDKVNLFRAIKTADQKVAFVGDGFNDAPALALSDVGIAMGGLGSDAAIETADIVIQDDNIAKLPIAIKIGKETQKIVWQNIALAFIVKAIVLILGAGGVATMWEAVFADVGVSLLAILNAVRIQQMNFTNSK